MFCGRFGKEVRILIESNHLSSSFIFESQSQISFTQLCQLTDSVQALMCCIPRDLDKQDDSV